MEIVVATLETTTKEVTTVAIAITTLAQQYQHMY